MFRNYVRCGHCHSSSFYCASVTNAPNVLQPYWFIVLPSDVPDLTASLLLWGPSGQRWRCLWTFLFSNVPTFASSRLQEILEAKGGITWARNGRRILPKMPDFHVTFRNLLHAVNLRHATDGFTSPPKERFRSGLNPRTLVPKVSTIPLDHRSRWSLSFLDPVAKKLSYAGVPHHENKRNTYDQLVNYRWPVK